MRASAILAAAINEGFRYGGPNDAINLAVITSAYNIIHVGEKIVAEPIGRHEIPFVEVDSDEYQDWVHIMKQNINVAAACLKTLNGAICSQSFLDDDIPYHQVLVAIRRDLKKWYQDCINWRVYNKKVYNALESYELDKLLYSLEDDDAHWPRY